MRCKDIGVIVVNHPRRRWNPNIQRMRVKTSGGAKRMRVCTRCLRSGKIQKAS